mmetsp:Transcript_158370/g.279487  ORF Transcript_158370/g.279487 Transcript_158370/m.279487 type:complete len:141 (-) Transcript_158370:12-434(-)
MSCFNGCSQCLAWASSRQSEMSNPLKQSEQFLTETLLRVPVFQSLGKEVLPKYVAAFELVEYGVGSQVWTQGEETSNFCIIESGVADVIVGGVKSARLTRGDFIGEKALTETLVARATIQAQSKLQVFVLTRASFQGLGC